jgi:hypothetical protein
VEDVRDTADGGGKEAGEERENYFASELCERVSPSDGEREREGGRERERERE